MAVVLGCVASLAMKGWLRGVAEHILFGACVAVVSVVVLYFPSPVRAILRAEEDEVRRRIRNRRLTIVDIK